MEYLCYTKSVLVYGYLIIRKYNRPSFWFWLRMEKLMKVCERKDNSPFLASHHHHPQPRKYDFVRVSWVYCYV